MGFFWPGIVAVIALGLVLAATVVLLPASRCTGATLMMVAGCRDAIR